MDVLSDVLRTLRLTGTVYFEADFGAPWGMDIKGGAFANFHLVVEGRCIVTDQAGAFELGPGDVVVFPHGDRHAIASDPSAPVPPAEDVIASPAHERGKKHFGGDGFTTTLVCGHFDYDRTGPHPLLASLPPRLLVRGEDQDRRWLETASALTAAESRQSAMGASAVVDRLAEVLLIQIIRAHANTVADRAGFLAALGDAHLASALQIIHDDPAAGLTVERLAREARLSRTVFAERFKLALGQSPMQYVTEWRMHRARERLLHTDESIAQIAAAVGYQSEFAFAKAFKRYFDEGPGAVRRQRAKTA